MTNLVLQKGAALAGGDEFSDRELMTKRRDEMTSDQPIAVTTSSPQSLAKLTDGHAKLPDNNANIKPLETENLALRSKESDKITVTCGKKLVFDEAKGTTVNVISISNLKHKSDSNNEETVANMEESETNGGESNSDRNVDSKNSNLSGTASNYNDMLVKPSVDTANEFSNDSVAKKSSEQISKTQSLDLKTSCNSATLPKTSLSNPSTPSVPFHYETNSNIVSGNRTSQKQLLKVKFEKTTKSSPVNSTPTKVLPIPGANITRRGTNQTPPSSISFTPTTSPCFTPPKTCDSFTPPTNSAFSADFPSLPSPAIPTLRNIPDADQPSGLSPALLSDISADPPHGVHESSSWDDLLYRVCASLPARVRGPWYTCHVSLTQDGPLPLTWRLYIALIVSITIIIIVYLYSSKSHSL